MPLPKRHAVAAGICIALTTSITGQARAQSADERLAAASALYDAHNYAGAASKLDAFLASYPADPHAAAAALALGRCRSALKQYPQAIKAFQKTLDAKEPTLRVAADMGLAEAALQSSQWGKAASSLTDATSGKLTDEQAPIAYDWLGQADYELGKYAAAETAYLVVTKKYADSEYAADANLGAGLSAAQLGKKDAARERFRTVVTKYPNSDLVAQAQVQLGQLDLSAKDYDAARSDFQGALSHTDIAGDDKLDAQQGLANALIGQGDFAGAERAIRSAMDAVPAGDGRRKFQMALGLCLFKQKKYPEALAQYKDASASADPAIAAPATYWAANSALAAGSGAQAAALFQQVADRYPKSEWAPKSALRAGEALMDAKKTSAATAALRSVMAKYPGTPEAKAAKADLGSMAGSTDDPTELEGTIGGLPATERPAAQLRLARLYIDANKPDKAAQTLTKLLSANPSGAAAAEANYLMGVIDRQGGKTAPAIKEFRTALASAPQAAWSGDAHLQLAYSLIDQNQAAAAAKELRTVLATKSTTPLSPEDEAIARTTLAQADLQAQAWQAAKDDATSLLAMNPNEQAASTALYVAAFADEKLSHQDDAAAEWNKLIADHPTSDYAADALLHLGDAAFGKNAFDDARSHYERLLKEYPVSPLAGTARLHLGSTLYSQEHFSDAAAAFDAVAADKKNGDLVPEALYWSGLSLDKNKDPQGAITRLKRLVADYPTHARAAKAKVRLAALTATAS